MRAYGTNNFPDCSNMCHEATRVGLPHSIGVGKGTALLEDFNKADCIFIFGQNSGSYNVTLTDRVSHTITWHND